MLHFQKFPVVRISYRTLATRLVRSSLQELPWRLLISEIGEPIRLELPEEKNPCRNLGYHSLSTVGQFMQKLIFQIEPVRWDPRLPF